MEKKQVLDTIVQKMQNDDSGNYLAGLLKIADVVQNQKRIHGDLSLDSSEIRNAVKNIDWLYGYESEIKQTFETLKSKLEKKIFEKDASRVTITCSMVCYCVLRRILNEQFGDEGWDEQFSTCNNNRILESLENLKRYCASEISVEGFLQARSYIRLWDREYNW